jgi:hydroxymethylglutaryl-CoA lyase
VRAVVEQLLALGVDEVDLGETLGVAEPADIARLYEEVARAVEPGLTTLHLHDSNGRALDNARAALALGVRSFDASAGGLGGCPYAPGARGNVDTAALVTAVEAEGYTTGVDREAVARAMSSIRQHLRPAAS